MKIKMIMNNYSFFDISDKKVKIAIRELQMIKNPSQAEVIINSIEFEDIQSKWIKNPNYDPNWRDKMPSSLQEKEQEVYQYKNQNKDTIEYWEH